MPRSMWKGAISFGLVTIPVAVYPATEEKTLRFNQLHDEDMGRIRYKRMCEKDGEIVDFEHIVKGYEYEKDRYVVLTDDDFDKVPIESSRAIDIQQFVDLDEIDPMMFKKSYYLTPDETGAKAYALLREAMSQDNKVGIAKVSFRDKEHLAALRFKDDAFVLETMYWPDEIREAEFGDVDVSSKARGQEVEMARQLIENLTAEWNPEEFTDEYREALLTIVEAKVSGEEIEVVEAEPTAKVVDLMEALKASVAAAKKQADDEPAPKRIASAKKPRREEDRCEEVRREEDARPRSRPRRRRPRARRPSGSDGSPPPGPGRPATTDDLDAIVALFHASDARVTDEPESMHEYLTWIWDMSYFDLERDARLLPGGDGPDAFAQIVCDPDGGPARLDWAVHPRLDRRAGRLRAVRLGRGAARGPRCRRAAAHERDERRRGRQGLPRAARVHAGAHVVGHDP